MTHGEFCNLLNSVHGLSPEQVRQLREALDGERTPAATEPGAAEALQRRLVESGVLSEIKPPITDLAPYRNRRAIPVQGEPLSATVIRERR